MNGCENIATREILEILKMLDAGGMMQIESVKNNNHELYVLSKPEKDQNNRILWNFNYFEDDMWETASLDCKDLQIYSNKVGNAGERIRNDIERQRTRDRKCICGPYI